MLVYEGRLFLGAGNSSNKKPAPNVGRVPVYSFDPKTNHFTNEYVVAEEQVNVFRVFNDRLYIPGHDATQKWDFGNFYTRDQKGLWKKYRTVPNALHLLDMYLFNQKMFVALGLNNQSAVDISYDNGKSWHENHLGFSPSRVYSFMELNSKLYACKSFTHYRHRKRWPAYRQIDYFSIGEYDGKNGFIERQDLTFSVVFPDTDWGMPKSKKIIRTQKIGQKAIYIGAFLHNDSHEKPFGAYVATSLEKGHVQVNHIQLPEYYVPWDIIVREESAYILCYDPYHSRVSVMQAKQDDLNHWHELFNFESFAFARSFELLNENFYFGIGCEIEDPKHWKPYELSSETGNILRVKWREQK
jgi:hypothetical protein